MVYARLEGRAVYLQMQIGATTFRPLIWRTVNRGRGGSLACAACAVQVMGSGGSSPGRCSPQQQHCDLVRRDPRETYHYGQAEARASVEGGGEGPQSGTRPVTTRAAEGGDERGESGRCPGSIRHQ